MSGICSVSCALSGGYGEDLLINYVCLAALLSFFPVIRTIFQ